MLSLYFLYNSFYNKKVNNIITFQNFNVLETHFLQLIKSVYIVFVPFLFWRHSRISRKKGGASEIPTALKGQSKEIFDLQFFFHNSNLLGHLPVGKLFDFG